MKSARKKFANMRRARERRRMESDAPEYPRELPELRRKIVITDYDFGEKVHVMELYRSDRSDCYKVLVDGRLWKKRIGFSRILAGIRKALPRINSL